MTEKTQIINKRLDQILYGTEWTHKIHEKVADTFEITDRLLTFISVLTTAFSGSGILAAVFSNNQSLRIAAAILAAISLFSTLLTKSFRFSVRATEQRHAAREFLSIRECIKNLQVKISTDNISVDETLTEVFQLSDAYTSACIKAPSTNFFAKYLAEKEFLRSSSELTSSYKKERNTDE